MTIRRELRYALRVLCRRPAFSITAVLVLALAMGANTTIFSVVEGVLLRPLPYHDPQRLCLLWKTVPSRNIEWDWTSYLTIRDWRTQTHLFDDLAVVLRPEASLVTLTGHDGAERIQGSKVSGNFFEMLGVQPLLGRTFSDVESHRGANLVVLSFGFWQRRFAGNRAVLEKTLQLDNQSATVIGVMPPSFQFPDKTTQLWMPLEADPRWPVFQQPWTRIADAFCALGRLKPGASIEQARADMNAISGRLAVQYPATDAGLGVRVVPLFEQVAGAQERRSLWLLSGAVLCVLLIACSNIASMNVARGASRRRELAVRSALGASRARLLWQLASESLLVSLGGGLAGLLLASLTLHVLLVRVPTELPRSDGITINATVLAFTFGLCLLTGIAFGLFPALQIAGKDPEGGLHEGGRGMSAGPGTSRTRGWLVALQFALAIVLLAGAGMLIRSFLLLNAVQPGFDIRHLLTITVNLPEARYNDQTRQWAFFQEALRQIDALPGVRGAAVGTLQFSSLNGNVPNENIVLEGQPFAPTPERHEREIVSDSYFRVVGIPLRQGRLLCPQDAARAPHVAVINETMARRFWPSANPIGKLFKEVLPGMDGPWSKVGMTVVGVVGDVSYSRDGSVVPVFYRPIQQWLRAETSLVIRTEKDSSSLIPTLRQAVGSIDSTVAIYGIATVKQQLDELDRPRRFQTELMALFAILAVILSALGLYGLMSSSVEQCTKEIGIRVALGATNRDVVWLTLRHGLKWVLPGIAVGIASAIAFGQVLSALLFGISANDPVTFATVIAILAVTAVACAFPTWRATKVDPTVALRHE